MHFHPLCRIARHACVAIALCGALSACDSSPDASAPSTIDHASFDPAVRPQDDLYRAVNGRWLRAASIPDDKATVGYAASADDNTQRQLQAILEAAAASHAPVGTPSQRLGDFYASFMDESRVTALGVRPLQPMFDRIDAARNLDDIAGLFGRLQASGIETPFSLSLMAGEPPGSPSYFSLTPSGTTLSTNRYFGNDAASRAMHSGLENYIARVLDLSGNPNARAEASQIFDFEQAIAAVLTPPMQTSASDNAPYNGYTIAELSKLAPNFNWQRYVNASGLHRKVDRFFLSDIEVVTKLDRLLAHTPIDIIKRYLKFRYVNERAACLPKEFEDAKLAMETLMTGRTALSSRASRAVDAVKSAMPGELADAYVERHFSLEQKAHVESMFASVRDVYVARISNAMWMTPATRSAARLKLEKMNLVIGNPAAPSSAIDNSRVVVTRDDLAGNVERLALVHHDHALNRSDGPFDFSMYLTYAFDVGTYYAPQLNAVEIPAAALQPPFYFPGADDATNYATMGMLIGHEMTHAIDRISANYDAEGNAQTWWTPADFEHYETITHNLVAQYDAYAALPCHNVNGAQTLAENVADNVGLDVAFRAYQRSLSGKPAPVIKGLTGEQRFYYSYAQYERYRVRERIAIDWLESDTHAPAEFRVNGTMPNQQGFYDAFGVKPTDRLYLPSERRTMVF